MLKVGSLPGATSKTGVKTSKLKGARTQAYRPNDETSFVQVAECIVCSEEWSDSVKRFQFDCGHAVICEECCKDYLASQEAEKGKKGARKAQQYRCPMGCDLGKNKRFKPAYLG